MRAARGTHAVVALALVLSYPLLPQAAKNHSYPIAALVTMTAVLVGVRLHRPASALPWYLLAAGCGSFLLGDVLYTVGVAVTADVPFPWYSDIAYLAAYPLLVAALALFLRCSSRGDRSAWLDAQIWTFGLAVLAWKPLIEPYLLDTAASTLATATAIGYPVMDLALVLMVVRVLADRAMRRPAGMLLGASLLLETVIDSVYGVRVLQGGYLPGELTDVGFLLAYGLLGAAALHPTMVSLTQPSESDEPRTWSRTRLLGLLAPAALAPAILVVQLLAGAPTARDVIVVAVAFAGLLVLLAARGSGLVAVAQRHVTELDTQHSELQAALGENRHYTIALQAALDDNHQFIAELNRRADHDTLTGLLSRDCFRAELTTAMAKVRSGHHRPAVVFIDVDDFKTVNDTLGHAAGDSLLVEVARRIKGAMGTRHVARFGGDEFAVLVLRDAERVAEVLLGVLREPVVISEQEIRVEVSIGVAVAQDREASAGEILREADIAMYAAKAAGGGWMRYRPHMSSGIRERLTMRTRLTQALAQGEIEPWFQPVVDLQSGRLVGFESLARWCRPGHPPLPPDEWLPWAEESGVIIDVDRAVLTAAAAQLAAWRQMFHADHLVLAVNMSARSLQHTGVERELLDVLHLHGIPPERFVLEVTEGVLIDDERIGPRLQRLRVAGVEIALDDFGTGWSSLSNLHRLPVDQLKLDRSFTAELGRGPTSAAVPAAIMQLSQAFSLGVVAEGVETQEQRNLLIELGYQHGQGYLFGPAESARTLGALLTGTRKPALPALPGTPTAWLPSTGAAASSAGL